MDTEHNHLLSCLLRRSRCMSRAACLTATAEHLAEQPENTKAELKESREDGHALQAELLTLDRGDGQAKK
ncbi:hypothetical protein ACEPNM_003169 [Salmonella enterica]|uniref:hypothetical protein n=3 Tax=Enterobacteriaceae TaxID=543 RepID=UPI00132F3AEF|nr:hypothetical protein [Salmonella enterica]EKS6616949.1 hypothetical protein [Enterobacter hormaechei]EKR9541351.1 hypothetical protein [Salmonella enterica]EKZ1412066.1 hypothetical protein [Salmonella enterica]ELK9560891.1 hypothetical protein [Salmonella enterica]ELK9564260.1 hypothetical protein [Salmonella enterica]